MSLLVPAEVGQRLVKRLTGEDLDGVHHQWLHVVTVSFDNGELMAIDGELKVGIARDRDKTKAVA